MKRFFLASLSVMAGLTMAQSADAGRRCCNVTVCRPAQTMYSYSNMGTCCPQQTLPCQVSSNDAIQLNVAQSEVTTLTAEVKEIKEALSVSNIDKDALAKQVTELTAKLQTAQDQLKAADEKLASADKTNKAEKTKTQAAMTKAKMLENQLAEAKKDYQNNLKVIEDYKKNIDDAKEQNTAAMKALDELKSKTASLTKNLEAAEIEKTKLSEELINSKKPKQQSIATSKDESKTLQATKDEESPFTNENKEELKKEEPILEPTTEDKK